MHIWREQGNDEREKEKKNEKNIYIGVSFPSYEGIDYNCNNNSAWHFYWWIKLWR